ncbi:MAG: HRDC domain-containing protein, partial [Lactobacillus sp.]|nr:HRDC domain-containing protein [Lactobacillus sp.]
LTILRELAKWREIRAQKKDTIRQSIIKDEVLLNIAAMNPISVEELEDVRSMRRDIARGKIGEEILETLQKANKISKDEYVKLEKEQKYNTGSSTLLELLKLLLRIRSTEQGVVARLIANEDDLKAFSAFQDKNNPILKGWRYEIFGKDAERLREGKLSISYNKDKNSIDIS